MENNDMITMSRLAFERMQAKDEKNDRFRNITIIVLIILLVVTNAMWLVAWNQYDYVDTYTDDYSVDLDSGDGGNANCIGNSGDIYNGEGNSNSQENQNEIESES